MGKKILVGVFALSLVGCSSYFTRKGCEKVNWFQHAHDVAMNGKRLQEDGRLRECEKAETEINSAELDRGFKQGMENYCKLDTALAKGANGDTFNYDFCDSSQTSGLRARFQEGLKKFCSPAMAHSFGSTGGVYKNQCPRDMEKAYLVKYRSGRKIFLKNSIVKNQETITALDAEIKEQQNLRYQLNTRLALLPKGTVVVKDKQYDAVTKSYKETTSLAEDPNIKRQRDNIESELRTVNNNIQDRQQKQQTLREESSKLNTELEGLNANQ